MTVVALWQRKRICDISMKGCGLKDLPYLPYYSVSLLSRIVQSEVSDDITSFMVSTRTRRRQELGKVARPSEWVLTSESL